MHTATVVNFSPDPNLVIPQTVSGVTSLLDSAAKEPSLKTFVYTSSSVAVIGGGANEQVTVDDSSWNTVQIKEAWSVVAEPFPATHPFAVYGASKAEAELACKLRCPYIQTGITGIYTQHVSDSGHVFLAPKPFP